MKYDPVIDMVDPDMRTEKCAANGNMAWRKYAAVHERRVSVIAFNTAAMVTGLRCFRSTHEPDGIMALAQEATRLREMRSKGYFVPEILDQKVEYLLLTDVGENLRSIVGQKDPDARRDILTKAVNHLAAIHQAGDYHGRPALRDLTLQNGKIGMIDLEHRPLEKMSLAEAQGRDAWVFLLDASKYANDDKSLVPKLAEDYARAARPETAMALTEAMGVLQPVTGAVARLLDRAGLEKLTPRIAAVNDALSHALKAQPA